MGPHDRAGPRVAGWSRLSARIAGLPLRVRGCKSPPSLRLTAWIGGQLATVAGVSTRKLIIAALLCGVAILVAGTILLFNLSSSDIRDRVDDVPAPTTTTRA